MIIVMSTALPFRATLPPPILTWWGHPAGDQLSDNRASGSVAVCKTAPSGGALHPDRHGLARSLTGGSTADGMISSTRLRGSTPVGAIRNIQGRGRLAEDCCQHCCQAARRHLSRTATLEHRPRAPTHLYGPGRLAQNYGSDARAERPWVEAAVAGLRMGTSQERSRLPAVAYEHSRPRWPAGTLLLVVQCPYHRPKLGPHGIPEERWNDASGSSTLTGTGPRIRGFPGGSWNEEETGRHAWRWRG
jgi:hypothetical protein